MADVASLLAQVATQAKDLIGGNADEARKSLIHSVNKLQLALETPSETTLRMTWAQRGIDLCIQTSLAMKLFDALSKTDPRTSTQLATACKADPAFVSRILKHLAATDIINETSSDHYTNTKFSESLSQPIYGDAFPLCRTTVDVANQASPEFFTKTQFQNPQNPMECAFQAGIKAPHHFFAYVGMHPEIGGYFNNHMGGYALGRKSWIDTGCYPVEQRLIEGADPEGVMLVDIGGGTGRDVNAFASKYGKKCVLEDLPDVIAAATTSPGVEGLAHDMFTEQPVKGARAYYMHSLLHDWPEPKCIEILTALKPAMKAGYSRLLINENVVPKENAYWMITGLDLIMMQMFAAGERTEEAWEGLLRAAGYKVNKIYHYETGSASLIEAELA